jgi:hypothetical protein
MKAFDLQMQQPQTISKRKHYVTRRSLTVVFYHLILSWSFFEQLSSASHPPSLRQAPLSFAATRALSAPFWSLPSSAAS